MWTIFASRPWSAVLKDVGLFNSDTVVHRNKIRRARTNVRKNAMISVSEIRGLWFDGKTDDTLISTQKDGRYHNSVWKEKHITIVSEHPSVFLGNTTVDDGSSLTIANSLMEHLQNKSISTKSLSAKGSDGEVTNTGTGDIGGVMHRSRNS